MMNEIYLDKALRRASRWGHYDMVVYLVERGANIHGFDGGRVAGVLQKFAGGRYGVAGGWGSRN